MEWRAYLLFPLVVSEQFVIFNIGVSINTQLRFHNLGFCGIRTYRRFSQSYKVSCTREQISKCRVFELIVRRSCDNHRFECVDSVDTYRPAKGLIAIN